MTPAESMRAQLLLTVVNGGMLAPFVPFAADMKHTAVVIAAIDGLDVVQRSHELREATARGCFHRSATPHGEVEVSLVRRELVERIASELTREAAGPVGFGEVRVVVIAGGGMSLGAVALAPSTRGVLA